MSPGPRRSGAPAVAPVVVLAVGLAILGLLAAPAPTAAQGDGGEPAETLSSERGHELVRQLMAESGRERRRAERRLVEAGDRSLVPAMVDALFFTPRHRRDELLETLAALTGHEDADSYLEWVEYLGSRTDLEPKDGYLEWKAELFSRIDPRFRGVFYSGAPADIRLEEIVSGGVPLEGIPALDDPPHVAAAEADFMRDDELVFGAMVGGEARAWPRRVLSWHEMLNDRVGGEPVTLSYCTLCGSAILYSTATPNGGSYTFGTSGLLYRSNKLMVDRQTYSLWSNITGEPVVGRLAPTGATLEPLPMTTTTWEEWRRRHPDTTVMVVDWDRGRQIGFDYSPGAADRARRGVQFPVWQKSDRLERDTEIYALALDGAAKAWPIEAVLEAGVVNDRLGDTALVLVGDAASGAVRAYRRGERTLRRGDGPDRLVDDTGLAWRLTEEALVPEAPEPTAETTEAVAALAPLERLAGHQAFWFGWYGYYPDTAVWSPDS